MKKTRITILLLLLCGLIAYTGYFKYPDEAIQFYALVKKEFKALKLSLFPYKDKYFRYLSKNEEQEILSWLNSGQYELLDDFFSKLTSLYHDDLKYEVKLYNAYVVFKPINKVNLEHLDEWVNQNQNKPYALTARAFYLISKAWQERGAAFISETSQEQIDSMHHYMKKGAVDIQKALAMDTKTAVPYYILIDIAGATGNDYVRERYFDEGVKNIPGSYIIRFKYLKYLEPKWGGSEAAKKRFVEEQMKYLDYNPGLIRLKARLFYNTAINYERSRIMTRIGLLEKSIEFERYWRSLSLLGDMYSDQHRYEDGIDLLTESISRHPNHYWSYIWRGYAYSKVKDYQSAEVDYKYAISTEPLKYNAYDLYVELLKETGRYDEALQLNQQAMEKLPGKREKWITNRADIYYIMKKYQEALELLKQIVGFETNKAWAWTRIGVISQYHIKNKDLSIEAHRKALQLSPKHYRYYNYAAALYVFKFAGAPEAFRDYLSHCQKNTCDAASVNWSKRFVACIDRKKTCDMDRHDYQTWLGKDASQENTSKTQTK